MKILYLYPLHPQTNSKAVGTDLFIPREQWTGPEGEEDDSHEESRNLKEKKGKKYCKPKGTPHSSALTEFPFVSLNFL